MEMEANIKPDNVEASHTFERKRDEQRGLDSDTWAIIKLKNSAPGAPTSIMVEGPVKCAICAGYTEDQLVCDDCQQSVRLVRSAGNIQHLEKLLDFAAQPGMLEVLERLTYEAVADLMMERIANAGQRD